MIVWIATPDGPRQFDFEIGKTTIFVGANGSGKSKLAAAMHWLPATQRINASRVLRFNHIPQKVNLTSALSEANRQPQLHNPILFDDNAFDAIIKALFAEQLHVYHEFAVQRGSYPRSDSMLEKTISIWNRLLPHRSLITTADEIFVDRQSPSIRYPANQMSDGEKGIFFLISKIMLQQPGTLIVVDEPELHIHPAILSSLWNEIERARSDCSFVVITHDIAFASSFRAKKFALREYFPHGPALPGDNLEQLLGFPRGVSTSLDRTASAGFLYTNEGVMVHINPPGGVPQIVERWDIDEIDANGVLDENLATLILGDRRPVLFVEGKSNSWDQALYTACFPEMLIIPSGSCEEVERNVTAMRANSSLNRIKCAGIIDADGRGDKSIAALARKGVFTLPVSEIENLFLLPTVFASLSNAKKRTDTDQKWAMVRKSAVQRARDLRDTFIARNLKRQVVRRASRVAPGPGSDLATIKDGLKQALDSINIEAEETRIAKAIDEAILAEDIQTLLRWIDGKGAMVECVASVFGLQANQLREEIYYILAHQDKSGLDDALRAVLPAVTFNHAAPAAPPPPA